MLEKMFAKQIEDRVQKLLQEELTKAIAHKEEELQLAHKQLNGEKSQLDQERLNFQAEKDETSHKLELIQKIEERLKEQRKNIHFTMKESNQLKQEIEEKMKELQNKEENLLNEKRNYQLAVEQRVAKEWERKNEELIIKEKSIDNIIEQTVNMQLGDKLERLEEREVELSQREEMLELPLYLDECAMYHVDELFFQYNDSEEYKQAIAEINKKMEYMVADKLACTCRTEWTVNGSRAEGRKQTNHMIKMALRLFNVESDNYISSINTRSNIANVKKKIQKSGDMINKFCQTHHLTLHQEYIDYKIELATLVYEQVMKKQEEKEEARRQAEIIREQEKLEREIAKEREKLAKEVQQYQTEIDRLVATVDMETGEIVGEVAERLGELQEKIEELQAQDVTLEERVNNKAGWVYCITNNSMPGSIKIGVTRRLNPQDRIDELGSASVPFRFNTNCVVFSEDAFALENQLHKAFHSKRVNRVNFRKEFFNVTTQEVEDYIKNNVDSTITFLHDLNNEEYLMSL